MVTLNRKEDGYRGIWYMNQLSNDEYVFKYSGGLATYCAKHQPFAVYAQEVQKTFFCYGGTSSDDYRKLYHMVSYYDHISGTVPKPTILLDKQTDDAHEYNHTYVRRPVNAHPDFYALWADGHARKPSPSRIYFCDREGNVRILPEEVTDGFVQPLRAANAD